MGRLVAARAKTDNIVDDLRAWVRRLVERLSKFPEVEGIVLLSSVAKTPDRPFADEYSDVDLAVFINTPEVPVNCELKPFILENQGALPAWLPDYEFAVPIGPGAEREVNIHQLLYSYEMRQDVEWPESKKEAYAYSSEVVYDRHGRVKQLIVAKTQPDFKVRRERLIRIAVKLPWLGWRHPERQLKRGFVVTAHDLLNQAVDMVIEGVFLLNGRYLPHRKWRLVIAEELPWAPPCFPRYIREALLVERLDGANAERRMAAVQKLWWSLINRALSEGHIPPNYEKYLATHVSSNRQLRVETLADRVVAVTEQLNLPINHRHLRGVLDFLVVESTEHFLEMLNDPDGCPLPSFERDWETLRLHERLIMQALLGTTGDQADADLDRNRHNRH